jgi:N-acetyl-D-muramate 6-phosphate phosphatase
MLIQLKQRWPDTQCVLFDLDGTLADTAGDLAAPVNEMRIERGLPPLPLEQLRGFASAGARGLLGKGLGVDKDHADFESLKTDFLRRYEKNMLTSTQLFPGVRELLEALHSEGIAWGVVSNKVEKYVRPICTHLGLSGLSKCLIGGDTAGFAKPHPAPLLLGASLAKVDTAHCVYVGDDKRDIEAAKAAGMYSVACEYGYYSHEDPPKNWGADWIIKHPMDLV